MKYSVIIPMYNVSAYILKCIDSILCQKKEDIEIIVIDDGSTDCSQKCVTDYVNARNCSNIVKILSIENSGASSARNKGIEVAEGEYIIFMDADDVMESNAFLHFDNSISKHPSADLHVFSLKKNINGVVQDSKLSAIPNAFFENDNAIDLLCEYLSYTDNIITWQPWSKIFKRGIIMNNNLRFDHTLYCCNDFDFFFKYTLCIKSISFNNNPTTIYTIDRPGAISNTKAFKRIMSMLNAYNYAFNSFNLYEVENKTKNKKNILNYISYLYICGLELSQYITNSEIRIIKKILKENTNVYEYSNYTTSIFKRLFFGIFGLRKGAVLIDWSKKFVSSISGKKNSDI